MRLLSASLAKAWRRPATRRAFIALAVLLGLIYFSIGGSLNQVDNPQQQAAIRDLLVFPAAYVSLASFLVSFGALGGAALAGLAAGGEWAWGTLRVAVARGESRERYVLATFAGVAILVAIGSLVLYAIGVALAVIGDMLSGIQPGNLGDPTTVGRLPAILVSAVIAILVSTALGFAIAFVTRNAIAGIVGVVALNFAEGILGIVIPRDLVRYGPTNAGTTLVSEAGGAGFGAEWLPVLGINLAYFVAALVIAAIFVRRAEIT